MTLTYKDAGVDQEKAGKILSGFAAFLKTRPRDPNLLSGIGPYASCYSLKSHIGEMEDPILVTCCDGVGTKSKLALDWNNLQGLGQDLIAMNVNDLLCVGAKPLVFLDYYACGKLDETQMVEILKSIQEGCEIAGCTLAGGETAEMPGLYKDKDFDLGGFAVGIVDKKKILGPEKVKAGDTLIAIASSGLHSNGYSLVRKLIEKAGTDPDERCPFSNQTWKETLLTPTRIYVKPLLGLLDKVSALAHITGGGLFENLPRVLPQGIKAVVQSSQWKMPELFSWIQKEAGIDQTELLTTLNCGVGMIVICPEKNSKMVLESLKSQGLPAWTIGQTAESPNPFVEWK